MSDTYVQFPETPVMRVKADMKGGGPGQAMILLESKLPTLKGRKFYGCFRETSEGEDYYACVAQIDTDDPLGLGLETGVIPAGLYAKRKILNWLAVIRQGQLDKLYRELVRAHDVDLSRFSLEYYRSQAEMQLLVPVRAPAHAKESIINRPMTWEKDPNQPSLDRTLVFDAREQISDIQ